MAAYSQMDFLTEPESDMFPDVSGLTYLREYIDQQQEADLIRMVDAQPWITELKRRVQHYGYRYDYKARNVTPDSRIGDIPQWLMPYCTKLQQTGLFHKIPDQVIINEYQPDQGIAPHTDCIPCFGDTIASLSLGSSCVMDFTHGKTERKVSRLLEARSVVVLSGEARYEWQHGIAHRKTDKHNGHVIVRERRISLTFRNVLAT